MENKFIEVMSKLTDDELIKIVTIDRLGYEPLAVQAAEQVIGTRNIDTSRFEEVITDLNAKLEEQKAFDAIQVSSLIRLLHFVVDMIAFLLVVFLISFFIGIVTLGSDQPLSEWEAYFILAFSFFAYFIIMEYKFQKTIGKFITKTKVVKVNGDKPQLGDIIARTFYRLIPFDRGSFLFAKNGFHDYLSKTTVVKDR